MTDESKSKNSGQGEKSTDNETTRNLNTSGGSDGQKKERKSSASTTKAKATKSSAKSSSDSFGKTTNKSANEQSDSYASQASDEKLEELQALQYSRQMEPHKDQTGMQSQYAHQHQEIWDHGYEAGRQAAMRQSGIPVYHTAQETIRQGRNIRSEHFLDQSNSGQHDYYNRNAQRSGQYYRNHQQQDKGHPGNFKPYLQQRGGQGHGYHGVPQGKVQQRETDSDELNQYQQRNYRSFESGIQDQDAMESYGQRDQNFQGQQPHFETQGPVRGESQYAGPSHHQYGDQSLAEPNQEWQNREQYRSHDFGYGENFTEQNQHPAAPREEFRNQNSFWGGTTQPNYEHHERRNRSVPDDSNREGFEGTDQDPDHSMYRRGR